MSKNAQAPIVDHGTSEQLRLRRVFARSGGLFSVLLALVVLLASVLVGFFLGPAVPGVGFAVLFDLCFMDRI